MDRWIDRLCFFMVFSFERYLAFLLDLGFGRCENSKSNKGQVEDFHQQTTKIDIPEIGWPSGILGVRHCASTGRFGEFWRKWHCHKP